MELGKHTHLYPLKKKKKGYSLYEISPVRVKGNQVTAPRRAGCWGPLGPPDAAPTFPGPAGAPRRPPSASLSAQLLLPTPPHPDHGLSTHRALLSEATPSQPERGLHPHPYPIEKQPCSGSTSSPGTSRRARPESVTSEPSAHTEQPHPGREAAAGRASLGGDVGAALLRHQSLQPCL